MHRTQKPTGIKEVICYLLHNYLTRRSEAQVGRVPCLREAVLPGPSLARKERVLRVDHAASGFIDNATGDGDAGISSRCRTPPRTLRLTIGRNSRIHRKSFAFGLPGYQNMVAAKLNVVAIP